MSSSPTEGKTFVATYGSLLRTAVALGLYSPEERVYRQRIGADCARRSRGDEQRELAWLEEGTPSVPGVRPPTEVA